MRGISCLLNFKENFRKNAPYYELLARQICAANYEPHAGRPCTFEHATLSADSGESIVTKVCEGYQFTVAFSGKLSCYEKQKAELSAFGYHFLSDSHAELALFSYIHFGEKCAEVLCGDFSLIIYDSMRRSVFAFGKGDALPVFYAKFRDFYILSSSLKGILSFPDTPKRLNKTAVLELISAQNRVPAQIFEGISMLPRNKVLKISQKGFKETHIPSAESGIYDETKDLPDRIGLILCDAPQDMAFLTSTFQEKSAKSVSVYAEKFSDHLLRLPIKKQHLLIDAGTVLEALKTSVLACGFPFLSRFDFLLPIALKQAKGMDEAMFFCEPDRFSSYKNYTATLLKNGIFHSPLEENLQNFRPESNIFPQYSTIIADFLSMDISVPPVEETLQDFNSYLVSQKLKTVLRRILLDIISKEHSPIFAFFRRSAILRLCEGGFVFSSDENEIELTAYLIKLNLWFEIFAPSIV